MSERDPIFRSVVQALNTAFILEYEQMAQKGATQIVVEDLRKRGGYLSEAKPDRGIDLGGMSPLEFRGQCAIIRRTVDERLHGPEHVAIDAYYGLRERQARGVQAVVDLLSSLCLSRSDSAIKAVVWSIYDRRQQFNITDISREYGVHKNTLARDRVLLRKLTDNIQHRAELKLEVLFIERGLVRSRDD